MRPTKNCARPRELKFAQVGKNLPNLVTLTQGHDDVPEGHIVILTKYYISKKRHLVVKIVRHAIDANHMFSYNIKTNRFIRTDHSKH